MKKQTPTQKAITSILEFGGAALMGWALLTLLETASTFMAILKAITFVLAVLLAGMRAWERHSDE